MTFLPLVERELRVASRRKATHGGRLGVVSAGLVLVFVSMVIALLDRSKSAGGQVFTMVSYYVALACVFAGVFLGAECISQERREGTLGFLFLTELKGYDVVLGKFIAVSLNAFYGLLAMFPLLAATVLGGGVTGGEFWRISLALVNVLFYATALSVLVSARLKVNFPLAVIALGIVIAIWAAGLAASYYAASASPPALAGGLFWLSMTSPGQPFVLAPDASYLYAHRDFWRALLVSHGAGWLFLALAAWHLDRFSEGERKSLFRFVRGKKRRIPSLLLINPVVWLLDDSGAMRRTALILGLVGAAVAILSIGFKDAVTVGVFGLWPFYFLLKILFATQACRFFAESRRSGALELLGATPLSDKEIVAGQWTALRRVFLVPVCILMAGQCAAFLAAETVPWMAGFALESGLLMFYNLLVQPLDFLAIGWCGMWLALTLRQPNRAVWITITVTVLVPLALVCVPNILIDLLLFAYAQNRVSEWANPRLRFWRDKGRDDRAMVRS